MHYLRESPTPEQWQVAAWLAIVLCVLLGSIGFYYSFQAPPEKLDLAREIRTYCWAFYILAGSIYALKRGVERWFG